MKQPDDSDKLDRLFDRLREWSSQEEPEPLPDDAIEAFADGLLTDDQRQQVAHQFVDSSADRIRLSRLLRSDRLLNAAGRRRSRFWLTFVPLAAAAGLLAFFDPLGWFDRSSDLKERLTLCAQAFQASAHGQAISSDVLESLQSFDCPGAKASPSQALDGYRDVMQEVLRGSPGNQQRLRSPRGTITDQRPVFVVDLSGVTLEAHNAFVRLLGPDLKEIARSTFPVSEKQGDGTCVVELPKGVSLAPNAARTPYVWEVVWEGPAGVLDAQGVDELAEFDIAPAKQKENVLGRLSPSGDDNLDRLQRGLALVLAEFVEDGIRELQSIDSSDPAIQSMRHRFLAVAYSAIGNVERTRSHTLAAERTN